MEYFIGNNYGIGEKRREELKGSCESLGIEASRCVALDHPDLQDNPKIWWNTDLIQKIVADHVKEWGIDAVSGPPLRIPESLRTRSELTSDLLDHHLRRRRRLGTH